MCVELWFERLFLRISVRFFFFGAVFLGSGFGRRGFAFGVRGRVESRFSSRLGSFVISYGVFWVFLVCVFAFAFWVVLVSR